MAHTAQEYADAHRHVMKSLNNLHIIQFDVVVAKGQTIPCSLIVAMVLPCYTLSREIHNSIVCRELRFPSLHRDRLAQWRTVQRYPNDGTQGPVDRRGQLCPRRK